MTGSSGSSYAFSTAVRLTRTALAVITLVLSCVAAPCPLTPAPHQSRDEAGLTKAEALWFDSLQRKDTVLLQCMLGAGFVDTTWQGQVHDRQQAIAALGNRAGFEQKVEITRTETLRNTGVVWGVNRIIDSKSHQPIIRIRFTDVFRYQNGRWVAIVAQETPEK